MDYFDTAKKYRIPKSMLAKTDPSPNGTITHPIKATMNVNIGDKIKILDCGHIYHYNCINDWFKRKKECPLCYK